MDIFAGHRDSEADERLHQTMILKLLDVVRVKRDIPKENIKRGMAGTIVFVFDKPNRAYEVEFSDDNGVTIAQLTLQPDELELAHSR